MFWVVGSAIDFLKPTMKASAAGFKERFIVVTYNFSRNGAGGFLRGVLEKKFLMQKKQW